MSLRIGLSGIRYPDSGSILFSELGLEISPGDFYLIKGGNGSGKTTLLNCVAGVVPEHIHIQGSVSIWLNDIALHDLPLRSKSSILAYLMADPASQILFPSLEKELCFALECGNIPATEMSARISVAIRDFGLEPLLGLDPRLLSWGQKKLLLLAVIQCMQTPIILLDEPSEGLSARGRALLKDWLEKQKSSGRIILAADHHDCLNSLADRIINLDEP